MTGGEFFGLLIFIGFIYGMYRLALSQKGKRKSK